MFDEEQTMATERARKERRAALAQRILDTLYHASFHDGRQIVASQYDRELLAAALVEDLAPELASEVGHG